MQIENLIVGMLEVNCYLVWEPVAKHGFVIDPGGDAEKIEARIEALGIVPRGILLTHAHVDHIHGVPRLARKYGVDVSLHPEDHDLYRSPQNELPPWLPSVKNLPAPGKVPHDLDGLQYQVYHTPGHTRGGVCYYFPDAGVIFTGDTLFRGGVGRTDLPGGNHGQLVKSIHEKLLGLPPGTVVYPGHGPASTIVRETTQNPFLGKDSP